MFHNICIEMLESGFHETFTELFTLVERQRKEHAKAGPACILLEPLIEHSVTKMKYLKAQVSSLLEQYLTRTIPLCTPKNVVCLLHHKHTPQQYFADVAKYK